MARKKKKSDKWKRSKTNTWVYVNGLPLDVTVREVHDHFAKCGVIQADVVTGDPRIKLYHNKESGGLNVSCYSRTHPQLFTLMVRMCALLAAGRWISVLYERGISGASCTATR